MWDTSALTKIQVRGSDALAAIDYLVTRDMSRIPVGKSAYCPILKDDGHFCDDGIIFHVTENYFLVASSIGPAHELLQEYAKDRDLSVERDEDLHIITVQGPKSVDLLDAHTNTNLRELAFCHQIDANLCGKEIMISRTGYSGERGYELFMDADQVVEVWQELMDQGQPLGLMPISFGGLEMVHIESGLMAYGAEANRGEYTLGGGLRLGCIPQQGRFSRQAGCFRARGQGESETLRNCCRSRRCGGARCGTLHRWRDRRSRHHT